jgi:hypothetical protein
MLADALAVPSSALVGGVLPRVRTAVRRVLAPWRPQRASARAQAAAGERILCDAIALLTGEPLTRAALFLRASDAGNRAFQADFDALAAGDRRVCERRIATVDLAQAAELDLALAGLGRPLVLACVHAGPYLGGLLRLLPLLPGARRLTLIRRPAACAREMALCSHLRALGVDAQVLRLAERPLVPALQALRDGRAVLTMIDVPPSFWLAEVQARGARQALMATSLLGHTAWLPEGPAALAVAAGAVVLPVHCSGSPRASRLHLGPLVDAARGEGESRATATARVHHALARQLDTWLRDAPEDWLLWRHLPAFFVAGDASARGRQGAIPRAPP